MSFIQPRNSKANGGTSSMPPCARLRPRLLFLIDPLAQFLAGFEMRHEFLGYVDPLARFRIAPDARRPMIQPETPESADLDALPLDQALRHRIEDHLDREFGVLGDELRITRRQPRNKFGLGHTGPRLPFLDYCCAFLLSNFALRSAPRLVLPVLAALSLWSLAIASFSSANSFCLTERLMVRFLRSTLMIIAVTLSPSLRWLRASSTRSREISEARR